MAWTSTSSSIALQVTDARFTSRTPSEAPVRRIAERAVRVRLS